MIVGRTIIEVVRGSVIEQDVDAIVNAANMGMRGGGGLDGAIHAAAGPDMLRELREAAPNGAPTGTAVVTRGHNLPHKWVIHTPGPAYRGRGNEDELLASSYRSSMLAAIGLKVKSIALPSISTGIYAFPIERAAPIALSTVVGTLSTEDHGLERVVFAMFGYQEYKVFQAALATLEK
jgi:O-acetyl-ADP-ribose deacetylase